MFNFSNRTVMGFVDVVKNGRQVLGMPRYQELGDRELDGLLHYIRQQAREGLKTAARD